MKTVVTTIALMLFALAGMAQKYAYVDTEYILSNIPTYEAAKEQLDELSKGWQEEINEKYKGIQELYSKYQKDAPFLSDQMKTKREDEIIAKEAELEKLQEKYFGPEGLLYQKRQELVKPIQDEIANTIQEIAESGNYALIFDTAGGGAIILFSDPRYDISDAVLKKMGYKN